MYIHNVKSQQLVDFSKFDYIKINQNNYTGRFSVVVGKCPFIGNKDRMLGIKSDEVVLRGDSEIALVESTSQDEVLAIYERIVESIKDEKIFIEI